MWKLSYQLVKQFRTVIDCKSQLKVALTLKTSLERFKINLPLINATCNPGFKRRHWKEINRIMESDQHGAPPHNQATHLRDMLKDSKRIERHLDELSEISALASKEYAIEMAVIKMKQDWDKMSFAFAPYKKTDDMFILIAYDDIATLLDDHIVKTNAIKSSPFIKAFELEVNNWFTDLVSKYQQIIRKYQQLIFNNFQKFLLKNRMKDTLEAWIKVQTSWMYLQPIFGSADIRNQMPGQGQMFETLDENW